MVITDIKPKPKDFVLRMSFHADKKSPINIAHKAFQKRRYMSSECLLKEWLWRYTFQKTFVLSYKTCNVSLTECTRSLNRMWSSVKIPSNKRKQRTECFLKIYAIRNDTHFNRYTFPSAAIGGSTELQRLSSPQWKCKTQPVSLWFTWRVTIRTADCSGEEYGALNSVRGVWRAQEGALWRQTVESFQHTRIYHPGSFCE